MKKVLSILMVLLVVISFAAVPASALDSAETVVSVNKGDEVIYSLNLSVPEKVVGCDFSIYYDSSKLKVLEVADFSGSFDPEDRQALINTNLKDEVRGNWSILSGVRFNNRAFCSVKFEAVSKADTHISYYVRYLYPESMQMFTEYTFTCDVTVNKKVVIEDEAPELNVDEPQSDGQFVNSVTGKGEDANVNTAEKQPVNDPNSNGGEVNENDASQVTTSSKKTDGKTDDKDDKEDNDETTADVEETTVSTTGGVDDPETVVASPSQTDDNGGILTSVWFWTIIAMVVIGGAAAYYFLVIKKKTASADTNEQ